MKAAQYNPYVRDSRGNVELAETAAKNYAIAHLSYTFNKMSSKTQKVTKNCIMDLNTKGEYLDATQSINEKLNHFPIKWTYFYDLKVKRSLMMDEDPKDAVKYTAFLDTMDVDVTCPADIDLG